MNARKRLSAPERRQLILDAGRAEFLRVGYAGATTRDIARMAGVTEAVLYRHFESKEQLFELTVGSAAENGARRIISRVEEVLHARSNPAVLETESELLAEVIRQLPAIGAMLFAQPMSGREIYRASVQPLYDAAIGRVAERLPTADAQRPPDQRARMLFDSVYGLNLGLALHHLFNQSGLALEEAAADAGTILLHGLSGAPPRARRRRYFALPVAQRPDHSGERPAAETGGPREVILRAARHLFSANGYAGTRTRDIAEAANTTEAVVFRQFSSKQEIFDHAIMEPLIVLAAELTALAELMSSAERQWLIQSAQTQARVIDVLSQVAGLIGTALFSDTAAGAAFYQDALWSQISDAAVPLGQAIERSAAPAVDAERLVLMLIGISMSFATAELGTDALARDEVSDGVTMLLAFGMDGVARFW